MNQTSKKNKSIIPLLLAGLIGIFIVFLGWSARQASTGGTDITDRDYYSKGLKYNSTLVEKRAASVIGWKLSSRLVGRILTVNLSDKTGRPIDGAIGRLVVSNKLATALPLSEKSPGAYILELPAHYSGEFPVRIDFERAGARISRQLLLNIGQ